MIQAQLQQWNNSPETENAAFLFLDSLEHSRKNLIQFRQPPSISPIIPELNGKNFLQRAWFYATNPPRFYLNTPWYLTLGKIKLFFPFGFETDFASIPGVFWNIPGFSPEGPLLIGSIPHDFAYQYGFLLALDEDGNIVRVFNNFPRWFFDDLLGIITDRTTGATVTSDLARIALKLAGWKAWNAYREKGAGAFNRDSLEKLMEKKPE